MHSALLRQKLALTVDTMAMRGPLTRRAAAEEILVGCREADWAAADIHDAKLAYLQKEVTSYMNEPLSKADEEMIMSRLPTQHWNLVDDLPRFICISERGGAGSQHVHVFVANREDWEANINLKAYIVERQMESVERSRVILDLLKHEGVERLADLARR